MDIGTLWYLIERDKLHRVVTAEEFEQLQPDSFTLHQVFDNRREALHEMIRLVQTAVDEVSHQVDEKTNARPHSK
ncbi:MAG: hypothetical protein EB096_09825 [Betaproteobacteria bacterium]|jgi:hypothetical protein|nr:hypothetical protein [Betaproteobacteria bacterium]NBU43684.1 hypothetical protein [Betaproteobacteria bacterium]NCW39949.1 hypothetical protein [Betaproteobacteria bacterium]NDF65443.1 hypothetical protein [Betaproteobacteria bacterium]